MHKPLQRAFALMLALMLALYPGISVTHAALLDELMGARLDVTSRFEQTAREFRGRLQPSVNTEPSLPVAPSPEAEPVNSTSSPETEPAPEAEPQLVMGTAEPADEPVVAAATTLSAAAVPACAFSAGENTFVLDVNGTAALSSARQLASSDASKRQIATSFTLEPGTYTVRTHSWDGYPGREQVQQAREQWNVRVQRGTSVLATVGPTRDLADRVAEDAKLDTFPDAVTLTASADRIVLRHAYPNNRTSANDVYPVCVAFERKQAEAPTPTPDPTPDPTPEPDPTPDPTPDPVPGNLVQNGTFESGQTGAPTAWSKGQWGTLTAAFTYPVAGHESARAAEVTVSNYQSGDAKWAFDRIPVTAGNTYRYENYYTATRVTSVVVEYVGQNGTLSYIWLGNMAAASAWTKTQFSLTVPAGVSQMTVYHLLAGNGTLRLDNVVVVPEGAITPDPTPEPDPTPDPTPDPVPGNLVQNGTFESGQTGAPTAWSKGQWGTLTAAFTYPVAGHESARAAEVTVSNYQSGDAKWAHAPVSVSPGTSYRYSGWYKSTVATSLVVEYTATGGAKSYAWLGDAAAAANWSRIEKDISVPQGTASLTVFHLLARAGTLTIDTISLVAAASSPGTGKAMLSITFDDAWRTQYTAAAPILDQYQVPGTFYVTTQYLDPNAYAGFMTPAMILDLQARGHEIGGHTVTHPDLTSLSSSALHQELVESKQVLEQILNTPVRSIAYPFGAHNSTVVAATEAAGYTTGRTVLSGFNTTGVDRYRLFSLSPTTSTPLSSLTAAIDEAIARGEWLVIAFHEIDYEGREYSNTPEYLEAVLQYASTRNIETVTVTEGYSRL